MHTKTIPSRHHPSSSTTTNAIPTRLKDLIFSTQNVASSLANSTINSNTNNPNASSQLQSLALLYTAGLWTSFSLCSLDLLPITVSYIKTVAKERKDKNTKLPTICFVVGLALVFTALGVSASALGGVFGSSNRGEGGEMLSSLLLAATSSLVSVFMGLQLLELIKIPLPSLDFRWRSAVLEGGRRSSGGGNSSGSGSLFDANGGLILENLNCKDASGADETMQQSHSNEGEFAVLLRTFLLGGTSALVASPCATPVLASLLAYLALASSSVFGIELWQGASWMLSYTFGYSTPLLLVGDMGGQALVDLQNMKNDGRGLLRCLDSGSLL